MCVTRFDFNQIYSFFRSVTVLDLFRTDNGDFNMFLLHDMLSREEVVVVLLLRFGIRMVKIHRYRLRITRRAGCSCVPHCCHLQAFLSKQSKSPCLGSSCAKTADVHSDSTDISLFELSARVCTSITATAETNHRRTTTTLRGTRLEQYCDDADLKQLSKYALTFVWY